MHIDAPQDTFWSLVAAYIDADDFDQLRQGCDAALFEEVALHVGSCQLCQERRREVLARRAGGKSNSENGT
jgi:hypothetical protein